MKIDISIGVTGFHNRYFLKDRRSVLCFKYGLNLNSSPDIVCLFLNEMLRFLKIKTVSCQKKEFVFDVYYPCYYSRGK